MLPDLAQKPSSMGYLGGGGCFWPGSQGGRDPVPLDIDYKGPGTSQNYITVFCHEEKPKVGTFRSSGSMIKPKDLLKIGNTVHEALLGPSHVAGP